MAVETQIIDYLRRMVTRDASDLHLTAGSPPRVRVDEQLVNLDETLLSGDRVKELAYSILTPQQVERFEREKELDMAFGIEGLSRYRVNVFMQKGTVAAAIRTLPHKIRTFEECGLPITVVTNLCKQPKGLVLVTGATGSGKSTTLASMINKINSERKCHVITVEDPIEYVFKNDKALIQQREVGEDTLSFAQSLRRILRQDPDVILIGEMRDLETIRAALNIAETGHLVFATLHTSDAVSSINRVIDVFPSSQQQQVRVQLSFVLMAVLSQQLIPHAQGKGRVLAAEVLIANHAVRSLIREAKIHQIYSIVQTASREGMRTMNQSLYELYVKKALTLENALSRTLEVEELERLISRS
ncbi:MAG: type IV pilus twitching motility protein PilT [Candidatus Omnitrophica bacterium]|nr:type IV pilus twitching motility protein PilT [Candidatus Omnitrophota bacterium]